MTDKDPKDMTASELLRYCYSRKAPSSCFMCQKVFNNEECEGHFCHDVFEALADKIDAELAEARRMCLDHVANLWAKANGWPDFRDSEDFGEWLERCFLPRPRYEDGEPVQLGELVGSNLVGAVKVSAIEFTEDGTYVKDEPDGDWSTSLEVTTNRLKRPAPEVLGADGLPLNEDDTVYGTGREQHRYTVQVPYSINEEVGKRFCVQCYDHDEGNITWCDPSMLTHERPVLGADGKPIAVGETVYRLSDGTAWKVTKLHHSEHRISVVSVGGKGVTAGGWFLASEYTHTPPDTQQEIDDDATMPPAEYCAVRGIDLGDDPDRATATEAMVRDLLRRQRELDKRTGGE